MGKHKTQRTDERIQAAKRYVIAEEVSNRIEQHNFDRLVEQGVIVEDNQAESRKVSQEFWQAHQALSYTIKALNRAIKGKSMLNFEGAGSGRPTLGGL